MSHISAYFGFCKQVDVKGRYYRLHHVERVSSIAEKNGQGSKMSTGPRCNCWVASAFAVAVILAAGVALSVMSPERSIDAYGTRGQDTTLGDPACKRREGTICAHACDASRYSNSRFCPLLCACSDPLLHDKSMFPTKSVPTRTAYHMRRTMRSPHYHPHP